MRNSLKVVPDLIQAISDLGVMISRTILSPKRKTFSTISASCSSTVPASTPLETRVRSSSTVATPLEDPPMTRARAEAKMLNPNATGARRSDRNRNGCTTKTISRSAWWAATVLGVISPITRSATVTVPVAQSTAAASDSPMTPTAMVVASAAAAVLKRLFPTSTVDRNRSGRSISRSTVAALDDPVAARCRSR